MAFSKNIKNISLQSKRRRKRGLITKTEIAQEMLADQQIIREAIQNGVSLKELDKRYG